MNTEDFEEPGMQWWCTSSGRIELRLKLDDAAIGYHGGLCDDDIAYLRTLPYIADQLKALDENLVRDEVAQYSDWDTDDHDANLNRLLWIACGDLEEEQFMADETEASSA